MNMASVAPLLHTLILVIISSGCCGDDFVTCEDAKGEIGKPTTLQCHINSSNVTVHHAILYKLDGEGEKAVVRFDAGVRSLSNRYIYANQSWPKTNNVSLVIQNTMVADEGKYAYRVYANRGNGVYKYITLNVTAKYQSLAVNAWPERNVKEGDPVDLYCHATRGYPKGSIHWFDKQGNDWTAKAELRTSLTGDHLVNLSSRLPIRSLDLKRTPFKCVVSNNVSEDEILFVSLPGLSMIVDPEGRNNPNSSETTNIVAGVLVIGSLLVGLLLALLFKNKCSKQSRRLSTQPMLSDIQRCPEEENDLDPQHEV